MFKNLLISTLGLFLVMASCSKEKEAVAEEPKDQSANAPFLWESANLYFLLTDRFNNGDSSNDLNFERSLPTATLRGFKGGDIKGITAKIKEGYFNDLGINAIWFTPVTEQIHGGTDEGTGFTYGFHGYWTIDSFGCDASRKRHDD